MTTQQQPLTNAAPGAASAPATRRGLAMLGGAAATVGFALLTTLWMCVFTPMVICLSGM